MEGRQGCDSSRSFISVTNVTGRVFRSCVHVPLRQTPSRVHKFRIPSARQDRVTAAALKVQSADCSLTQNLSCYQLSTPNLRDIYSPKKKLNIKLTSSDLHQTNILYLGNPFRPVSDGEIVCICAISATFESTR